MVLGNPRREIAPSFGDLIAMRKPAQHLAIPRTLGCLVGFIVLAASAHAAGPAEQASRRLYREKIEPLLTAECYRCHSAKSDSIKGGLRLDSRPAMLAGGDTGPAVVPG